MGPNLQGFEKMIPLLLLPGKKTHASTTGTSPLPQQMPWPDRGEPSKGPPLAVVLDPHTTETRAPLEAQPASHNPQQVECPNPGAGISQEDYVTYMSIPKHS